MPEYRNGIHVVFIPPFRRDSIYHHVLSDCHFIELASWLIYKKWGVYETVVCSAYLPNHFFCDVFGVNERREFFLQIIQGFPLRIRIFGHGWDTCGMSSWSLKSFVVKHHRLGWHTWATPSGWIAWIALDLPLPRILTVRGGHDGWCSCRIAFPAFFEGCLQLVFELNDEFLHCVMGEVYAPVFLLLEVFRESKHLLV